MELTDKCKKEFDLFMGTHYGFTIIRRYAGEWNHAGEVELSTNDIFEELPKICQQTLIIDFFDQSHIDIRIGITYDGFTKKKFDTYVDDERIDYFENRFDAMNAGIIKANEIYNSL